MNIDAYMFYMYKHDKHVCGPAILQFPLAQIQYGRGPYPYLHRPISISFHIRIPPLMSRINTSSKLQACLAGHQVHLRIECLTIWSHLAMPAPPRRPGNL